jgi:Meiotically up-regulated gene 113
VIFSPDAVTLEHQLHQALEEDRLNRVNQRKEFFLTTPSAVRDVLEKLAGNHLLVFNETPEAAEWRMSSRLAGPVDAVVVS